MNGKPWRLWHTLRLKALSAAGYTDLEIATALGFSRQTIRTYRELQGIPRAEHARKKLWRRTPRPLVRA